ncbi:MAG: putative quinol monooxygenase, partial [Syntrophorhabdaceae bacterium]
MIRMKVLSEKRVELSQTIASLIVSIRILQGCERCDFCQSMEDENELCLLAEWDTRERLDDYLGSEGFKILHGASNLLKKPYDITFHTLFNPGANGGSLASTS